MGVPRTLFLTVIAIPTILSTASFLLLFYAVWVEQFAFRLYNKLYIRKCFRAVIVDDCLALYRFRRAVERCRGSVRRLGSGGAARKEAKDEKRNEK